MMEKVLHYVESHPHCTRREMIDFFKLENPQRKNTPANVNHCVIKLKKQGYVKETYDSQTGIGYLEA